MPYYHKEIHDIELELINLAGQYAYCTVPDLEAISACRRSEYKVNKLRSKGPDNCKLEDVLEARRILERTVAECKQL